MAVVINHRWVRTAFPWKEFKQVCEGGLGLVRPYVSRSLPDPAGWKFGRAWAPSYYAFGRMRALLAITEGRGLKPRRALEVAAGDGSLCAALATDGCEVVANDLREEPLRAAIADFSNRDRIQVRCGNLFDLQPDQLGTFDLVIACEILEHVAYTVEFLTQLRRFIAPGGHALVTTPNGAFFRNKLPTWSQVSDFKALEAHQFKPDADGHLFLITPSEMQLLAGRAGFTGCEISVWGAPFLTGNAGLARFSNRTLAPLWTTAEAAVQYLPSGVRTRICTAMSAVLST